MYTTNTIESLNSSYRRINNQGQYSWRPVTLKSIYLATVKITSKWTMRYKNWGLILDSYRLCSKGV